MWVKLKYLFIVQYVMVAMIATTEIAKDIKILRLVLAII